MSAQPDMSASPAPRPGVAGLETEYGISVAGRPGAPVPDPMALSDAVVRAAGRAAGAWSAHWDYADEQPLVDARGNVVDRRIANPDLLTDVVRQANVLLPTGARVYVDHAHPEHSGPETTSAREALAWDRAGDEAMQDAARAASEIHGLDIRLHKNTTDGKGHSYGCHENYLVARSVAFERIVAGFSAFLASRVIVTGAGRVGLGVHGERPGFQLSQRADFFQRRVGLETTTNRPVINTRDEPHADARAHRRLHVITGDANLSETSTFVKIGSAQLVLAALAAGADLPELVDPVLAFREFSHDPGLQVAMPLVGGGAATALDLQRRYLDAARSAPATGCCTDRDAVLDTWAELLDDLATDPMRCADRLDWVAKLRLVQGLVDRGLPWTHPKLAAIDLQYADLDPSRSLFTTLEDAGHIRRRTTPGEIAHARREPPASTRAWLRGHLLQRFPNAVVAANWDSVSLRLGDDRVRTIALPDPLLGSRAGAEALLAGAASVDAFVRAWDAGRAVGWPDE